MSIHAALNHVTHYKYDRPVRLGPQVVRLRPAPHCRSNVMSYSLRVEPANHFINWQQDPFANYQARLVFPEPTTEFKVTVDLVVEMAVYNPFDFFLEPSAENFPFKYEPAVAQELAPYLAPSRSRRWCAATSTRSTASRAAPSTSWSPSTSRCRATSST
jgi:transglutaminase-like putative cysteine protease